MADQDQEYYEEQHRRWYAEWVRRQYDGPGCRAKIVGRVKYEQIVRAVRGELRRAADNSKFRFWVRAKGFRMGRPAAWGEAQVDDADSLYVVDTRNGGLGVAARESRQQHLSYKKVAVVDEFFDIIYRVHCSGGDISTRHSGQKRTHRMIMETYAFLPREAVTAFLMGCPQCTTNMSTAAACATATEHPSQPSSQSATTNGFCPGANVDQSWSMPFACSTPVKSDAENLRRTDVEAAIADSQRTAMNVAATAAVGPDKENVLVTLATSAAGNKRKRTLPLKRRDARQPCQVIAASGVTVTSTSGGESSTSTLKNSSGNSSCTLVLSSPSSSSSLSSRTEHSGVSRSSGGWWSKWGMCKNISSLRTGASGAGGSSDLSCVASNAQPLDLSSSPVISPAPTMAILSSSSATEDFFYKRRRVRRRRVRPKRLNRSCLGRYDGYHAEGNDTSVSDGDVIGEEARTRHSDCDVGYAVSSDVNGGANVHGVEKTKFVGERELTGCVETGEEDDGPRPAKIKKILDENVGDNNNDDDYFDKTAAAVAVEVAVTTTTVAVKETMPKVQLTIGGVTDDNSQLVLGEFEENNGALSDESEKTQEKSAAMHSPMNKRLNGGSHHPYHMHSRSIMNGLATSSSPSSLSKTLDTITTSSAAHHNFHRHWLDMASDSVTNTNLMDVDGSTDDNSMAAAAAAAAAALLFSPPSSVGNGISPGGPLSSLHPNSHLTHHHALSPLAPLALPPHSAASVGLTSAHHHHHIQQQLQQYAAAAVAAATAAAAAAAAASTAGDSTSPPPTLPLTLPSMAHHYNQNNNISGSNKRRSTGGAGLTVQQQLYRRSGTPTSSTISSPSPMPLNSKNDADTTTSSTGLHENGSFSASGPPTTTTTVLWPPLGLLTAAHQQHHHSLSSPPKFQQLFGSSVNSFTAVTAGSQILSSLPPPPISSPSSSSYRTVSKETNGMVVTTSNGTVTGNDIGTGTGNTINADEEDTAIDDEEDEEDEEDDEEEEDLDDDDVEEGEEDGYEDEEGDKTVDGSHAQARRMRRQQVRRLRRLQRASNTTNNANDCTDSGVSTNYQHQWQQPSTTTSTASSQQQNQQLIGSSSQQSVDPERLKAFNMFVRLFVDENLDRQVPISRQPKDKVQAIIDSCGRQFPELSDRSRKRIRTYLKSCRRNKRNTPQSGSAVSSSPPPSTNPWPANGSSTDSTAQPQRPTPAHLTSAQAETILAVACQRESDNARRMRLGLEPVAQPYPYSVSTTSASSVFQQPAGSLLLNQNGNGVAVLNMSSTSSDEDAGVGDSSFDKSSSNAIEADTEPHNGNGEIDNHDGHDLREGSISAAGGNGDISDANNSTIEESNSLNINCGISVTSSSPNNIETTGPTDLSVNKSATATTATVAGISTMAATSASSLGGGGGVGYACGTGFRGLSSMTSTTTVNHRRISSNNSSSASTGMLQLFPTMATTSSGTTSTLPVQPSLLGQPTQPSSKLLNKADVVTVRQLIAGYRESAAFLLRSADELEHLLLLRG